MKKAFENLEYHYNEDKNQDVFHFGDSTVHMIREREDNTMYVLINGELKCTYYDLTITELLRVQSECYNSWVKLKNFRVEELTD